jgi:valyl-tRNA synthetase
MVVERDPKARGLSRHDIGREKFLEEVWRWKEKHGGEILSTLRRLGASCDWSRLRFTMDEGLSKAVREVFVTLYEDGLIYRAEDLINWCPSCRTALSELEVETEDGAAGRIWEIAYPLFAPGPAGAGEPAGETGRLIVATTRPETMLGDTAVAVHPEDDRYRGLIGREVVLPLLDRRLPIIGDAILVDPAFGTGVVKVTPAHDFNDFETGKRHGLPLIAILDEAGRVNANGGPYAGLDRFEARKRVLADLDARGLLISERDHVLPLRRCARCDTIVEPHFSKQWFVKIAPLAAPALEVVENGTIGFVPELWKKTYYEWMRNIHDWCISRQLWWGHRIPAWYCGNGHITVAREAPESCATCASPALRQEDDVLDTWFSSALWPFSTLGWPDETPDLRRFYPTSVLSTGPDIIFFWVARMIMMGLRFRGEIPFSDVYFHGLVRDAKGEKMSKTRGNVLDPDDLIAEMGADPLRFTLAILASPGSDIPIARERMEGYRAFANKLWNASRFVLMNLVPEEGRPKIDERALRTVDRWILGRYAATAREVNRALAEFRFDLASQRIYSFLWDELCDWYIEWFKPDLLGRRPGRRHGSWKRKLRSRGRPPRGPRRVAGERRVAGRRRLARRGLRRSRTAGPGRAVRGPRGEPAPPPPVHASRDGGALAEASGTRAVDRGRRVSGRDGRGRGSVRGGRPRTGSRPEPRDGVVVHACGRRGARWRSRGLAVRPAESAESRRSEDHPVDPQCAGGVGGRPRAAHPSVRPHGLS